MPRSSQVPPFTQGLRKQGEGAARAQGVTNTHPVSLRRASGRHGAPLLPPLPGPALPEPVFYVQPAQPLACVLLTHLAVPPGEAWGTVTLVLADVVEAGASVVTGA